MVFSTLSSPNLINPALLSPADRLAELADILARGVIRLRARQSTGISADCGDTLLDCTDAQSVHGREQINRRQP